MQRLALLLLLSLIACLLAGANAAARKLVLTTLVDATKPTTGVASERAADVWDEVRICDPSSRLGSSEGCPTTGQQYQAAGRVEVLLHGMWQPLCYPQEGLTNWSGDLATFICKQKMARPSNGRTGAIYIFGEIGRTAQPMPLNPYALPEGLSYASLPSGGTAEQLLPSRQALQELCLEESCTPCPAGMVTIRCMTAME